METIRVKRQQPFKIKKCPACKKKHSFNLTAIIDEVVGGMFMMTTRVEIMTCSLTCPDKGTTIVVEVPVTLMSGQSLVEVQ